MTQTEAQAPDMNAMMEAWAKYAIPSAGHEHFRKMAGCWDAIVKVWCGPDGPPNESKGVTDYKLIFGDRYLLQEFTGEAMGQPFEGMGLTGCDNFRRRFNNIWLDSMSTCMMISHSGETEGECPIEYTALVDDPMTGRRDVPMRMVARFDGDDTHVIEMYRQGPDGKEQLNMEITYTRRKS